MTQTVVDARALPPAIRHPRIFETFDALAPGECFVLVNDHYPLPLLYQFQAERRDAFDWSVLEADQGRFRVEIRKRDAREPRGVGEYLTWDHRRLDALWEATKALVRSAANEEASARYAEFQCGLGRHIDAEERVLFPAFEAHAGESGPTEVMRAEHAKIRKTMVEIAEALASGHGAAVAPPSRLLEAVLSEHNAKEERVLYPMIDRIHGDAERADLVRRMQTLPA
jgi:uncharacterized protein (DUF2249 family)/hemerythrin-like domain-containing protein